MIRPQDFRDAAAIELGASGITLLLASNLGLVVVLGLLAARFGAAQRATRHQLEVWSWHLEQLLPSLALPPTSPASSAASRG
jgi:hypothetical protein